MVSNKKTPPDYFTPDDWKALHAAGVAVYVTGGRSRSKIDSPRLDRVLAHALLGLAPATTDAEFVAHSITAKEIAVNVLGMPAVTREAPVDKKTGEVDENWVHPVEGMAGIIGRHLRTASTGSVQSQILSHNLVMFKHQKVVEMLNTDGLLMPSKEVGYAVTRTPSMMKKYIADPDIDKGITAGRKATKHYGDLVKAVPGAAAELLGALDSQIQVATAQRTAAYDFAVKGMDPEQRELLDTKLAEMAEQRGEYDFHKVLASTDRSAASAA